MGKLVIFLCFFFSFQTYAWENHSLGTAIALNPSDFPDVTVEKLEDFLMNNQTRLELFLDTLEEQAVYRFSNYAPCPSGLRFKAGSNRPSVLKKRFWNAIRVNPNYQAIPFLQKIPGRENYPFPVLSHERVSLMPALLRDSEKNFVELQRGDRVSAYEVLVTASDEPDYGLDISLWEDSGSEYGKIYKFGKQPFGNPHMSSSTQAPFHMGFFHEDSVLYKNARFLETNYVEYRIQTFLNLAIFAFQNKSWYWGWRFTGMALHYYGDLTQAYHSRLMPGVSTFDLLLLGGLDKLGLSFFENSRIQIVSNRHFALEKYVNQVQYRALLGLEKDQWIRGFLEQGSPVDAYTIDSAREVVSREAYQLANRADRAVRKSFPKTWVSDSSYVFGTRNENVLEAFTRLSDEKQEALKSVVSEMMKNLGAHTRSIVKAASDQGLKKVDKSKASLEEPYILPFVRRQTSELIRL